MRLTVIITLAACSIAHAADAPSVTSLACAFRNGQTACTWTDPTTGTPGNYRYDVYWSTSAITGPVSLAAATLIQNNVFNNSAQLMPFTPFTQATRTDVAKPTVIVTQGACNGPSYTICGTQVAALTGVALHTATQTASAYYAVITTDTTSVETDSPVSVGNNAITVAVSESVGTILPLKLVDSHDATRRQDPASTSITGTTNLPLWARLNASGGCSQASLTSGRVQNGDYLVFWGDSTMGYQEGVQSASSIFDQHSGSIFGTQSLIWDPCDLIWTRDALTSMETYHNGYQVEPLGAVEPTPRFHSITQATYSYMLNYLISTYSANPQKVFCNGQSMGGWGCPLWALPRGTVFAGVFVSAPRFQWNNTTDVKTHYPNLTGKTFGDPTTTGPFMSDGVTSFTANFDMPAYVTADCSRTLPFLAWGIGRQDGFAEGQRNVSTISKANPAVVTTATAHGFSGTPIINILGATGTGWSAVNATFTITVTGANTFSIPVDSTGFGTLGGTVYYGDFKQQRDMSAAMTTCHQPYAFSWSDGDHNAAPALLAPLLTSYGTVITKNVSRPALTSFSLDGNPLTDVVGCINCGWTWTTPTDATTTWSTALSNSQIVSGNPTVSVTPRNVQSFNTVPGTRVGWLTSRGQTGIATADAYGVVTAVGVQLATTSTTITFDSRISTGAVGGKQGLGGGAEVH